MVWHFFFTYIFTREIEYKILINNIPDATLYYDVQSLLLCAGERVKNVKNLIHRFYLISDRNL